MKKIFLFLLILTYKTQAQSNLSVPSCPDKVEFSNVMVNLDAEAQTLVNQEINNLLTPPNKFLDQKLERMQWYLPLIEKVLEAENAPDDLKYLAIMESSLMPEAVSSSNAVGFWQFKEPTAKEMGLIINNQLDERKNIILSTKAAANYLKKNNLTLKNWISAILSFNTGLQGANQWVPTFWSNANEVNFSKTTHEYLIKALASRIALEHRVNRIKDSEKRFVEYTTNNKTLAEIALELTTNLDELKKYNTWLNTSTIPANKLYSVLILAKNEEAAELEGKIKKRLDLTPGAINYPELKRLTTVSTAPDAPIFYTINGKKGILALPGDDINQLATRSKIKIKKFLSLNDLTEQNQAQEGKVYYLQKKNSKAKVPYHTLSRGQNFWDVAQMYGIKLNSIYSFNKIKKSDTPVPGRVLWLQKSRPKNTPIEYMKDVPAAPIPSKEIPELSKSEPVVSVPKPKDEPVTMPTNVKKNTELPTKPLKVDDPIFEPKPSISSTNTYTVKQGDNLFSIAKLFGLSVDELRKLNGMASDELVLPGQKLKVLKDSIYTPEPKKEPIVVKTDPPVKAPVEKPVSSQPVETKITTIPAPTKSVASNTHIVQKGETAFSISKKYGLTVNELLAKNKKTSPTVELGEALIVGKNTSATSRVESTPAKVEARPLPTATKPEVTAKTEPKPAKPAGLEGLKYHTVAAGETLYSISKKYGQSTDQVKNWNKMTSNTVVLGQKLIVSK